MDKWQKDWIEENLEGLQRSTSVNPALTSKLLALKLLTLLEIAEIERCSKHEEFGSYQHVKRLYLFLMQRKNNAYDELIRVLNEEFQTGAADILQQGKDKNRREIEAEQNDAGPPVTPDPDKSKTDLLDLVESKDKLEVKIKSKFLQVEGAGGNYKLSPRGKRYVLILNVIQFSNGDRDREGGEIDTIYMTQLWEGLGFTVFPKNPDKKWFTTRDIENEIKGFRKRCEEDGVELFVVFVGSHGNRDHVCSSNEDMMHVEEDIVYKFGYQESPKLNGVPKIFIVQACQGYDRGGNDASHQQSSFAVTQVDSLSPTLSHPLKRPTDGRNSPDDCDDIEMQVTSSSSKRKKTDEVRPPRISNAIVIKPQTPGGVAYRDTYKGSWFVLVLTFVLMNSACNTGLLKMLGMSQALVPRIDGHFDAGDHGQMPTYVNMGLQEVYLLPKAENK